MARSVNVALVGATGVVGREFIAIINEGIYHINQVYLFASAASKGKKIKVLGQELPVAELTAEALIATKADYAFFATSAEISGQFIPAAAAAGICCIDNSSHFRMRPFVPLMVPALNIDQLTKSDLIISIPNCSTIQCVMPLKLIDQIYHLKRVIYTTYQSVSGSGKAGIDDLRKTQEGQENSFYPYKIAACCIPQIETFTSDDYTTEEHKMVDETRKILGRPELAVTATCVRVPLFYTHAAAIIVETEKEINPVQLRSQLSQINSVIIQDDPANQIYPVGYQVRGKNEVFIGRIRRDNSQKCSTHLWVVSDNLRRGAAYNGIEIMVARERRFYV